MHTGNRHSLVKDLVGLAYTPYLSLQCCFYLLPCHWTDANIHLQHAITKFNAQVSPHDAITIEVVIASPPSQRTLSKRLDTQIFQTLLASYSPVDNAGILSTSAPHAGSWISVVPSPGLNLHLDPAECPVAIRWWLGLDTSGGLSVPFLPWCYP